MAPPLALSSLPPLRLHGIPDGIEGVRATLAMMAAITREWRVAPIVAETARQIVAGIPGKDHEAEMVALFEYVRDQIRYVMDPNAIERLQTPDYTLQYRQGDCDDQSILLASLLESIGIPARFVAVGFVPDGFEHVYVEAAPDFLTWIALDPTEHVEAGWAPPDVTTRINQDI